MPVEIGALTRHRAACRRFIEEHHDPVRAAAPWILLAEGGGTPMSPAPCRRSAIPAAQQHRSQASTVIGLGMAARILQAHNIPPGMNDAKSIRDNAALVAETAPCWRTGTRSCPRWSSIRKRALEELNSDWTASQELAACSMAKHKLPFRVGHHFASEIVDTPRRTTSGDDFPYAEAQRFYRHTLSEMKVSGGELPRQRGRVPPRTRSGRDHPQPRHRRRPSTGRDDAECWPRRSRRWGAGGVDQAAGDVRIDSALAALDRDFGKILARAN